MNRYVRNYAVSTLLTLAAVFSMNLQAQSLDKIVATVDGAIITESEVQTRMQLMKFDAAILGREAPQVAGLRDRALDSEIRHVLRARAITNRGIQVSNERIDEVTQRIAAGFELTVPQFEAELENFNLDLDDYRELVWGNLLLQEFVSAVIVPSVNVTDLEVERYMESISKAFEPINEYDTSILFLGMSRAKDEAQRRQLRTVRDHIKKRLESGRTLVEVFQEVRIFDLVEYGNLGWRAENEFPENVLKLFDASRDGETIGPVLIEQDVAFFNIHRRRQFSELEPTSYRLYSLRQMLLFARNQNEREANFAFANELSQRISAGESFEELEKLYRDDTRFRNRGEDLGWVPEDELPAEFRTNFAQLNPGDVGPVFISNLGIHVILIIDKRMSNLEEAKTRYAMNTLRENKARSLSVNWEENLVENSTIVYRQQY